MEDQIQTANMSETNNCGQMDAQEHEIDWLTEISNYPPILDIVMNYISLRDLKNLKLTNSEIYRNICDSGRMEKIAILNLYHPFLFLNRDALGRLKTSRWNFRSVRIHLEDQERENQNLKCVSKPNQEMTVKNFYKKRNVYFQSLCKHHLERFELTGLGECYKSLAEINGPRPLREKVSSLEYRKLIHLDISDFTLNGIETEQFKPFIVNLKIIKIQCAGKRVENKFLLANMKMIAQDCNTLKEYYWGELRASSSLTEELVACYAEGILANINTLTKLVITHGEVIVALKDKILPCLKHVVVAFNWTQKLQNFLVKQPFLEVFVYERYPSTFAWKAITFILSRSKSLKKLVLSGPNRAELLSNSPSKIQWDVLSKLNSLTTFHLIADKTNPFLGVELFSHFPPSLTTIRLTGVCKMPHPFPNLLHCSTLPFVNIHTLTLEECRNILDDQDLQYICRTFTKLRKLQFEMCLVTDFGVTGISANPDEIRMPSSIVSVNNLKCLTHLKINRCPNITNAVGQYISFENLEILELIENSGMDITADFKRQIWKENSRLRLFNYQSKENSILKSNSISYFKL